MSGMTRAEEFRALAARQHGVVTRDQLLALGVRSSIVAHEVRRGRLERLSDRVYRIVGSPCTLQQRATAAALDVPGGVVSRHSAAALWELPGYEVEPVHVLSDRRPHRGGPKLGTVHSSTRFGPLDTTVLAGVPLTTPLRTLRDLAGRVHPERLSQTCDRMLARRLIRLDALHRLDAELPRRGGAPGTRAIRDLIRARPADYRAPESNLERRFESILERAGDAPFDRQVDVGDRDGWIGRVDFIDRPNRLIVEIQSDLFHGGEVERAWDEERMARLRSGGWTVLAVTESDLWYRPQLVLARVRVARRSARRAA
jgi:very-short-patch-repair endonuclease